MILILERDGLDDVDVVAKWQDGEFFDIEEEYRTFDDPTFEQYDEEMMLDHFDGPDLFATTEEAWESDQPTEQAPTGE